MSAIQVLTLHLDSSISNTKSGCRYSKIGTSEENIIRGGLFGERWKCKKTDIRTVKRRAKAQECYMISAQLSYKDSILIKFQLNEK